MRVRAVILRILRQFSHDKRTVGLMIFAPILVLTLMTFIFGGSTYEPKIAVINAPLRFVNALEKNEANVFRYTEGDAYMDITTSQLDAVINFERGVPKILLEGSDPKKSQAVMMVVQNALMGDRASLQPDVTYLYGYRNMATFDNFGPILIGFFVFFFVFLIAGVSFLGERNTGTLERTLATPIRRYELVLGYVGGFGIFTVLQSTLIAWYCIHVLHVLMVGSFFLVLLVTILTALVALSMGTFISAFASNELQMIQFIPIVVVPQVFFSGLFDLSTMSVWLQRFGRLMPLYYVADALQNIMIRGKNLSYIMMDIGVLLLIFIFFMVANIVALKKHRKI